MVLSFYKKHLKLNEELRKILTDIIIEYIVQHKIYASPQVINYISDNIINLFKSEVKVCRIIIFLKLQIQSNFIILQETYFISVPGKKPKGILYQKYHNTLTKLCKHKLWSPIKKVKRNFDNTIDIEDISILKNSETKSKYLQILIAINLSRFKNIILFIVNENLINVKKWLQFNVEPQIEVNMKWQETCEIRREFILSINVNINNILEEWPMFKQSFGHSLVKNDLFF